LNNDFWYIVYSESELLGNIFKFKKSLPEKVYKCLVHLKDVFGIVGIRRMIRFWYIENSELELLLNIFKFKLRLPEKV